MEQHQLDEILNFCANNNTKEFNLLKAIEECNEFSEVLIKLQTKSEDKKPNLDEAIKEFGDVHYRGVIALLSLFPNLSIELLIREVDNHIHYKLQKLINYKTEGKYTGGL
jgi:hypothetical protein